MAVTDLQRDTASEAAHAGLSEPSRAAPSYPPRCVPIALWASVLLFVALAQQVFVYTPDDSFITFRYAKNLAAGYGPVFNRNAPLSDRTEGYSCPLFLFLMALLWKLPLGLEMLLR
ncbi:MAG TPA: hypothetical protein VFB21_01990, partial [Chthonomonadaceae bacterium]|nr:hypothetical protein [Chthonomonadaceae bacterium]